MITPNFNPPSPILAKVNAAPLMELPKIANLAVSIQKYPAKIAAKKTTRSKLTTSQKEAIKQLNSEVSSGAKSWRNEAKLVAANCRDFGRAVRGLKNTIASLCKGVEISGLPEAAVIREKIGLPLNANKAARKDVVDSILAVYPKVVKVYFRPDTNGKQECSFFACTSRGNEVAGVQVLKWYVNVYLTYLPKLAELEANFAAARERYKDDAIMLDKVEALFNRRRPRQIPTQEVVMEMCQI